MVTLKPTTPLLAPRQGSLETGIASAPENCTKNTHFAPAKAMTVSTAPLTGPQRRRRFQSRLGQHPQRRWWFQTGPPGRQGQTAVPMGGGGAWPGFDPTHRTTRQYTKRRRCGGRRKVRRARAGFEIDHSEP